MPPRRLTHDLKIDITELVASGEFLDGCLDFEWGWENKGNRQWRAAMAVADGRYVNDRTASEIYDYFSGDGKSDWTEEEVCEASYQELEALLLQFAAIHISLLKASQYTAQTAKGETITHVDWEQYRDWHRQNFEPNTDSGRIEEERGRYFLYFWDNPHADRSQD